MHAIMHSVIKYLFFFFPFFFNYCKLLEINRSWAKKYLMTDYNFTAFVNQVLFLAYLPVYSLQDISIYTLQYIELSFNRHTHY